MRFAILFSILTAAACGGSPSSGGPDAATTPDAATSPDAAPPCTPTAGAPAERVTTTVGVVHGAQKGSTWAYLGVPFAAPPVGPLRLAPPAAPACSATELDATQLGPMCAQLDSSGKPVGSEDCLQLNVWAPAAAAAPRPVFVWIHGGANAVGSATDATYDGQALAETGDMIVVTVNYRLGQLGFLAHPGLSIPGEGDYGLLDQIAALHWVHDNIAAFGGDPANVTIAGESAGARDVCSLVASPKAAGLFAHGIMESGSCKGLPTKQAAEATGSTFVTDAGCGGASDVAACLRALPLATMLTTDPPDPSILVSTLYQPMIDGDTQPVEPASAIAAGTHNHVPFIVGANADETGKAAPQIPDEPTYESIVNAQFGPIAAAVLKQYPASDYATPRAAYVRLTTDARFVCPSREIARAFAAGQTEPVFRYFFSYPSSNPYGAVHGLDVPFVFGSFGAITGQNGQPYQPTATDLAVSAVVQADWSRMSAAGDPGGTPAWPRWDSTDPAMVFAATPSVQTAIRQTNCDFWQQYYDAN